MQSASKTTPMKRPRAACSTHGRFSPASTRRCRSLSLAVARCRSLSLAVLCSAGSRLENFKQHLLGLLHPRVLQRF